MCAMLKTGFEVDKPTAADQLNGSTPLQSSLIWVSTRAQPEIAHIDEGTDAEALHTSPVEDGCTDIASRHVCATGTLAAVLQ